MLYMMYACVLTTADSGLETFVFWIDYLLLFVLFGFVIFTILERMLCSPSSQHIASNPKLRSPNNKSSSETGACSSQPLWRTILLM